MSERKGYRASTAVLLVVALSFWNMASRVALHDNWTYWLMIPYGLSAFILLVVIGNRIDGTKS